MSTLTPPNDVGVDALAEALLNSVKRPKPANPSCNKSFGQCLVKATKNVLASMCSIEVSGESEDSDCCAAKRSELSGVISLSGTIEATIVLNVSRDIAISATEALLGEKPTSVDETVLDTLGEITNMIGGNAKDLSSHSGATLGLPTIVSGANHHVALGANMDVSVYTLHTSAGDLKLELAVPSKEAAI